MKKISVIIPVYNTEKYLKRCVDSVREQTYGNLEIILVDDGSPDGCPQMCDAFAAEDDRIKVIHKENAGVAADCAACHSRCSRCRHRRTCRALCRELPAKRRNPARPATVRLPRSDHLLPALHLPMDL